MNRGWSSLLQTLIHLVSSLTARNITRLFWSLYLDLAKINGDPFFASDIEPENFKRTGKMLVVHNVGVREVPVVGHKVRPPAVNSNVNDIPLSIWEFIENPIIILLLRLYVFTQNKILRNLS